MAIGDVRFEVAVYTPTPGSPNTVRVRDGTRRPARAEGPRAADRAARQTAVVRRAPCACKS